MESKINNIEEQTQSEVQFQKRLFSFFFSKKVPPIPQNNERPLYPEMKVNPISQLMFFWMNPILRKGYKRTLQYEDCFKMNDDQKVAQLKLQFKSKLDKLIAKNGTDKTISIWMLMKAFHASFYFDVWLSILFRVFADTASALSPLLLKKLVDFVSDADGLSNSSRGKGIGYAFGCALLILFTSVTMNYSFYRASVLGCKVRSILTSVILEKTYKINAKGLHDFNASKINAIISTDLARIDMGIVMSVMIIMFPIPLAISIALLIVNIGVSALAGLACFILTFVVLAFCFKLLVGMREKATKYTDTRISLTKELLTNFKMVKLYSWEDLYTERIEEARNKEMSYTLTMQTVKNLLTSVCIALPNLSSMVAFLTASRVSPNRSAGDIFGSLSLFQSISLIFFVLPMAVSTTASAKVGVQRIAELLSCDDAMFEELNKEEKNLDSDIAIKADNCCFKWTTFDDGDDDNQININKKPKKGKNTEKEIEKIEMESFSSSSSSTDHIKKTKFDSLYNINLEVKKGEFIVVVGPIGSGKSSFLQALSGFMDHKSANLQINGEQILSATPWIKNDTIRENIVFGLPFEQEKYQTIIDACALGEDFKQFAGGDLTEVGERGITLSGGQKARICLARSVYANKDIIYLDDILSAVDAKVGKHIVEACINKLLKFKTVILATHQLSLANNADKVVFMNGDGTVEVGELQYLIDKHSNIKDFFKNVDRQKQKQLFKEGAEESNELSNNIVKIVNEEIKAVNSIDFDVYKTYYNLGVGCFKWTFISLFTITLILSTFTNYFSNIWLSFWIGLKFVNRQYGFYVGLYILFNLLFVIFTSIEFVFIGYFCVTASKYLNLHALKNLLHAPVAFMDVSPLGRVLNRFTKDTDVLDNEISEQMRMAIYPLAMMVGAFILCIVYLPWFAISIPFLVFLYVFLTAYYQASSRELKRIDAVRRSLVFTHFNESVEGMNTIKAYKRENYFIEHLNELMDNNNEVYLLTWAIQRWVGSQMAIITFVFILLVALLCCFRVFKISAVSTGLLLTYAMNIPSFLAVAIRCLAQIETEFNSVERLYYYCKKIPQEAARETSEVDLPLTWPANSSIEFKNVSLKYRPELPYVIQNLNLSIKNNEKVGFCGRTGAGKSSFMSCLYRLTEFEGCVEIDGVNIQKIGLNRLRQNLTIIPQDPVLFVGTIRSNIDPFNNYDDETLWKSLVISGLIEKEDLEIVKSQCGGEKEYHKFHLNRAVEDNGSNFSLGERQLIALARALVKKTKFLILDEATSNVDYKTDKKIQDTIATEFSDCTILSIAHRLNTIISFDRIVVMDAGKVVQFDTPKNLFKDQGGLFRQLCEQSNITAKDFS